MIDRDDYELIVVVADSELRVFLERLIERGQERGCLRRFRWRIETDAMRDAICSRPDVVLDPYRAARFAIMAWDHAGSGRESEPLATAEAEVVATLAARGWEPANVVAVGIEVELESTLVPVWERTKSVLAAKRQSLVPTDPEIASAALRRYPRLAWPEGFRTGEPDAFRDALGRFPKEVFQGLVDRLQLRTQPALFDELGLKLSLPGLKAHPALGTIASRLGAWFPGPALAAQDDTLE